MNAIRKRVIGIFVNTYADYKLLKAVAICLHLLNTRNENYENSKLKQASPPHSM
jgi:hypothetical protein